jgi:hypothetical protein
LGRDAFRRGDSSERDRSGREIEILIIRRYAVLSWTDHAVEEVTLTEVRSADRQSRRAMNPAGVGFDPAANAYRAIVHSWDNAECIGEPREWQSSETFTSEDAAMSFCRTRIRPGFERLLATAFS